MREQLEALEELAKADLARRQVDIELGELKSHIETLQGQVDRIRELLDRERKQLAEDEKARLSHSAELEAIAEKTARSKKRHENAKNNRELEATSRELEVLRQEKDERAAKAASLDEVTAQRRASIQRHEGEFAQLVDELKAEETQAQHRREELLGQKLSADGERKKVEGRLRKDILAIYDRVATKRGTGVSDCSGGVCRSCHISLPPQLYNTVLNADRIHQCPNCQRILMPRLLPR